MHDGRFLRAQRTRFVEDDIGNTDFAKVMQQSSQANQVKLLF